MISGDILILRDRWTWENVKYAQRNALFNDIHDLINGLEQTIRERDKAIADMRSAERFAAMLQQQMGTA